VEALASSGSPVFCQRTMVWSGVVESCKEASALTRRLPTLTLSLLLTLAAVSPADAEIREYQAYRSSASARTAVGG
jgi:hypothetical protein